MKKMIRLQWLLVIVYCQPQLTKTHSHDKNEITANSFELVNCMIIYSAKSARYSEGIEDRGDILDEKLDY